MTPAAIAKGIDQVKALRAAQTAAWMSGNARTALARQSRADSMAVEIGAALRASSYWAEDVKASLLRQIGG